ncbi:MAG: V-type ATPase 116kDa subunit family protein [Rhabdochlamydiaceae bacterium]|nr:V-type ATPase 116kDa subunit family protein [Candidatus Amphrikana amoebophyrae]
MISDVKKMLFIGVKEDLDLFFSRAQTVGRIEFIRGKEKAIAPFPKYIEEMVSAMKVLKHYPSEDTQFPDDSDAHEIVERILHLQKKMETLQEERIHIKAEIEKMRPLGDFSLVDVQTFERLSNKNMIFFSCKRGHKERDDFPESLIYITSDHELDFFMYVGKKCPEYNNLNELTFTHTLSEWREKDVKWKRSIKEVENKLKEMASLYDYLYRNLTLQLNHVNLVHAKDLSEPHLEGKLFAINGWVPKKKENEVASLCDSLGVHFEDVAIEKDDRIPTYMENKKAGAMGEDLVHIYDTPAPEDKDPSRWVLFAFTLFFAMIVSDAGYGFLYFLIAIFLRWKVYKKAAEMMKRFIKLVLLLSTAAMIWGVFTCSYFSVNVAPDNPISKYSLLNYLTEKKAQYHIKHKDDVYQEWVKRFPSLEHVTTSTEFLTDAVVATQNNKVYAIIKEFNDNILMEFSLLVGIIHVALSFLRNLRKCFAGLGWVAFMVGCYFFFPKMLNATTIMNFMGVISKAGAYIIGYQLLIGGMIFATVASLIQNKMKGIGEIVTAIQIFADVLSYLRLYALGLAGMIMAATFNEMGAQVHWAIGVFITVAGHAVNIVLGIMGGVIHGLRLNFLEWYHYSFEGGGKIFNPLRSLKVK